MLNWLVAASKLHKHKVTCCTAEWPFYVFLFYDWVICRLCDSRIYLHTTDQSQRIKQLQCIIINTYWLRPRETVCFVDQRLSMKHRQSRVHKTYCFPEVSVNKYFIIYWVPKEKKSTTNQSNMCKKDYLLPDMATWGFVDLLSTGE